MIKIEDVEVMGMRKAIKGMRNALNSWDKSDSYTCDFALIQRNICGDCRFYNMETYNCNFPYGFMNEDAENSYIIGEVDMKLCKNLIKAGSADRKFLRMIHVQADVTAPLYWWKEFDTYKVGTVANSCSTMHTIHKKEFTLDDFSTDHFWDKTNEVHGSIPGYYGVNSSDRLRDLLKYLNWMRTMFIETKDKAYWWQMIQLFPSSFNQMRTIDLDYETLFSIYHQRKCHKLDEWREFCKWIETLPYMKEFLGLDEQSETKEQKQ